MIETKTHLLILMERAMGGDVCVGVMKLLVWGDETTCENRMRLKGT